MDAHLNMRWSAAELLAARPKSDDSISPPWIRNTTIAQYELGDMVKSLMYAHVYGSPVGYVGDARMALADLLTMLRCVAQQFGWSFWETMRDGEEKYIERMAELRAREELN